MLFSIFTQIAIIALIFFVSFGAIATIIKILAFGSMPSSDNDLAPGKSNTSDEFCPLCGYKLNNKVQEAHNKCSICDFIDSSVNVDK